MTTAHPGALVTGAYLRHLRQTRQLTLDQVHGLTRLSRQTVNLVETGRTVPVVAVERLIAAYGIEPAEAKTLLRLLRAPEDRTGMRPLDDEPGWQARLAACEAAATVIMVHAATCWPPVLHTPAYTAAWCDGWDVVSAADRAAADTRPLPARHGKSVTVFAEQWWVELDRRPVQQWRDQLAHVIAFAERGDISVRLVPNGALIPPRGVQSELWLGPGRALYVEEYAHGAYYSCGEAGGGGLEKARARALSPAESLTRLQSVHARPPTTRPGIRP
ncbi:Scr1 family TA system antitoxin-like transcriptional regulator [Streptomyces sp. NPDC055078]